MPRIHPTSVVDAQAELAEDVEVGPWCRIDGRVRLGPGSRLLERVTLRGPLVAGAGNIFYPNACVGFAPQHRNFSAEAEGPGVVMGDGNVVREGVTVHRATGDQPTRLGDQNYLMAYSHLGHDAQLGNGCTLANNVLIAGHVEIGDRVTFGGGAGIHQFCRIGRLSIIGGLVGLTQDVPPFCACYRMRRIGSLNIVGLRRAGCREHVAPLRRAFDLFFRRAHSNPTALRQIREELGHDPLCLEFATFIEASRRGITAYGSSKDPTL